MNKPIKHTKKRKPARKLNKTRRNKDNMKTKKSIVANEIYKLPVGSSGGGMWSTVQGLFGRLPEPEPVPVPVPVPEHISEGVDSGNIDVSMQESDSLSEDGPEIGELFSIDVDNIIRDYNEILDGEKQIKKQIEKLIILTDKIEWKELLESLYSDIININDVNNIVNTSFFEISNEFIENENEKHNIQNSAPYLVTSRKEKKILTSAEKLNIYEVRMEAYKQHYLGLIRKNTNIKNITMAFLEQIGIEPKKYKKYKKSKLLKLKERINSYFSNNATIDTVKNRKLYTIKVNDSSDKDYNILNIDLTYTKLGYAIMLFTEINHDFKQLDSTYKNNIKILIKSQLEGEPKLIEIFDILAGNQQLTSELCLYISSKLNIPRIIRKEGKIKIQLGNNIAGMGIYPINGLNTTIYTSDADNSASYLISQQKSGTTLTINSRNQLLKLDGGTKPKLSGIQETQKRIADLFQYAKPDEDESDDDEDITIPVDRIKPLRLELNIYRPDGKQTIKITKIPNGDFNFFAYDNTGVEPSYTFRSDTITQNLINTHLDIIRKTKQINNPNQILLSTNLIKSVGDMVPYIVTCCQLSLEHDYIGFKNVCASIDYSMVFQVLSEMTYLKNGIVSDLQNKEVIVGCPIQTTNTGTSNLYFPFTDKEKKVYRILYEMAEQGTGSEPWKAINKLSNQLLHITHFINILQYPILLNAINEDGGCNIPDILKINFDSIDRGLITDQDLLHAYNEVENNYKLIVDKLKEITEQYRDVIKNIADNNEHDDDDNDGTDHEVNESQLCISNMIYNLIQKDSKKRPRAFSLERENNQKQPKT
jgi:hypothetical protein